MQKGEIARNQQFLLSPQSFQPFWIIFYHFHQIQNCGLRNFSLEEVNQSVENAGVAFVMGADERNEFFEKNKQTVMYDEQVRKNKVKD